MFIFSSSRTTIRSFSMLSVSHLEFRSMSSMRSEAELGVGLRDLAPVDCELLLGDRVHIAARALDGRADLLGGGPAMGPLEHQVLGKVRDPRLLRGLVPGADAHEDADANRAGVGHLAGEDAEAVAQGGLAKRPGHEVRRPGSSVAGATVDRPWVRLASHARPKVHAVAPRRASAHTRTSTPAISSWRRATAPDASLPQPRFWARM